MRKNTNVLLVGYFDKKLGKMIFHAGENALVTDFQSARQFKGRGDARVAFRELKRYLVMHGKKNEKLEIIRVIVKRGKP